MKKTAFLIWGFLLVYLIQATTIIVDIEGNGDHTSIQAGINASVDGDTVLVYPGRYIENTDFNGKSIAIGSLEMTTGNRNYIHSTIIDANQSGCCVAVHNDEGEGTILRGFTITNGIGYSDPYGTRGGGIYTSESTIEIINCIVEYNSAEVGGGILIEGGQVSLAGSTFRYNSSTLFGGGIASWCLTSPVLYSIENRCNSYFNFSPLGKDVFNSLEIGMVTDVFLDTLTVFEPFGYEFYQGDYSYNQNYEDSEFEMLNAKLSRLAEDLFVSSDGNDTNSGLSEDEPLQTLNRALQIVTADEENPRTIYLADGIYSTEANNQLFPISMRSYVSLIGESRDNTIIDLGVGHQGFVLDLFSEYGYEFRNFTVRNGFLDDEDSFLNKIFYLSNRLNYDCDVLMENIKIENIAISPIISAGNINIILRNVMFDNYLINTNCVSFRYTQREHDERSVLLENCQNINFEGGILYLSSDLDIMPEDLKIDIVSCEFTNHVYHHQFTPQYTMGLPVFGFGKMELNIINNIFSENHTYGPGIGSAPIRIDYGMVVEIINNIIFSNTTHSLIIECSENCPPSVTVNHNIIEGGLDGILESGTYYLDWDEETNWDVDPMFLGEGEYPYSLQDGSPAINMGTLDLPEGIVLPEYDLAGNLRIMGNGIDLGAYEYSPYSNPVTEDVIAVNNDLVIYPNPLMAGNLRNDKAKILWQGETSEDLSFEIFNIKGQRVRELKIENVKLKMNSTTWDLCDDTGNQVSSGVYFVRVKTGDDYIAQSKLTVVK